MRSRRRTFCVALVVLLGSLALVGSASASATFTEAFGWGVKDGASSFESCTSSCEAGGSGSGAGQFHDPIGVAVDGSGDIFVADFDNNRIDEFDNTDTFVRSFGSLGSGLGQLDQPSDVAVDGSGNVYVADTGNDRIDEFSNTGSALGSFGSAGTGAGQLSGPRGVAVDSSGNVFVGDVNNNRIDEFSSSHSFTMAWGWGVRTGAAALETCTTVTTCKAGISGGGAGQLDEPTGVAANGSGVYVADFLNNRIDQFSSSGAFIRAWGWGVQNGGGVLETCFTTCEAGAGGGGYGQLQNPRGVGLDSSGNVYVGDTSNNRIDEYSSVGVFIQSFGSSGSGSGQFDLPIGVAIDSHGLYVADDSNQRIDQWAVSTPSGGGSGSGGTGSTGSGSYATTTSLYSSLNPSSPGDEVTFTASVSPDPASGTVAFTAFGYTLPGCGAVPVTVADQASCTVSLPTADTYPIEATFSGSSYNGSTYKSSQAPILNQVVTTVSSVKGSKTTLSSSNKHPHTGQEITLTATVSPSPGGGSVKFLNNGHVISGCRRVSLSGGQATCTTRFRVAGRHGIQTVYSGDSDFVGSQSSTLTEKVHVKKHKHKH